MTLSDGLDIIFSMFSGVFNILMSVQLFGIPIGLFIISAFVVSCIMKYVFFTDSNSGGGDE